MSLPFRTLLRPYCRVSKRGIDILRDPKLNRVRYILLLCPLTFETQIRYFLFRFSGFCFFTSRATAARCSWPFTSIRKTNRCAKGPLFGELTTLWKRSQSIYLFDKLTGPEREAVLQGCHRACGILHASHLHANRRSSLSKIRHHLSQTKVKLKMRACMFDILFIEAHWCKRCEMSAIFPLIFDEEFFSIVTPMHSQVLMESCAWRHAENRTSGDVLSLWNIVRDY